MIKIPLLLFMLASFLFFFYPGSEEEEDKANFCQVQEEDSSHYCYIRCQGYGDHWRGCCVPFRENKKEPQRDDLGKCACCQRDYSKNRDFCKTLVGGKCPTLYDQSTCFFIEGNQQKRYCSENKKEMQRNTESTNSTQNFKRKRKRKIGIT